MSCWCWSVYQSAPDLRLPTFCRDGSPLVREREAMAERLKEKHQAGREGESIRWHLLCISFIWNAGWQSLCLHGCGLWRSPWYQLEINMLQNVFSSRLDEIWDKWHKPGKKTQTQASNASPGVFFLKLTGFRHKKLDSEAQVMGRAS